MTGQPRLLLPPLHDSLSQPGVPLSDPHPNLEILAPPTRMAIMFSSVSSGRAAERLQRVSINFCLLIIQTWQSLFYIEHSTRAFSLLNWTPLRNSLPHSLCAGTQACTDVTPSTVSASHLLYLGYTFRWLLI